MDWFAASFCIIQIKLFDKKFNGYKRNHNNKNSMIK